ncbi:MAG: hypothetical protein IPG32_18410 [Saprospirales bacterium]|nr:hypothetical protein [Saprospirales bacterium]
MEKFLLRFFGVFMVGFISTFSFPHSILPDPGKYLSPWFEKLAAWTGRHVFGLERAFEPHLISDSTGFYLHAFNAMILSLLLAAVWTRLDRKSTNDNLLRYGFIVIARYYLALQLLVYGLSKVFKWQFYMPEPNTLFTPLGYLHRDILFWSAMGVSRSYTVFSGLVEVLPALLLLFRPTRLAGGLIAAGVMTHVLALNLSFDISVKLYSAFLLLLCLFILAPDAPRLWAFFFTQQSPPAPFRSPAFRRKNLYLLAKTIAICLILTDALYPYLSSGNFNDDRAPRPPLHGAYEVMRGDSWQSWQRVFIHRKGYFITQSAEGRMQDYGLIVDTLRRKLILEQWEPAAITEISYWEDSAGFLLLEGDFFGDSLRLGLRKLALDELPLLKPEFNWTVD